MPENKLTTRLNLRKSNPRHLENDKYAKRMLPLLVHQFVQGINIADGNKCIGRVTYNQRYAISRDTNMPISLQISLYGNNYDLRSYTHNIGRLALDDITPILTIPKDTQVFVFSEQLVNKVNLGIVKGYIGDVVQVSVADTLYALSPNNIELINTGEYLVPHTPLKKSQIFSNVNTRVSSTNVERNIPFIQLDEGAIRITPRGLRQWSYDEQAIMMAEYARNAADAHQSTPPYNIDFLDWLTYNGARYTLQDDDPIVDLPI